MRSFNKFLMVGAGLLAISLTVSKRPALAANGGLQNQEPPKEQVDASKTPKLPAGAKQLKPMFLDKSLFTPDKWWKYEEADDDRPFAHSVEQTGSAAFGSPLEEKHGASIRYRVISYNSAAEAHQSFKKMTLLKKVVSNVSQQSKSLHKGNESIEITAVINDLKKSPQEHSSNSYIRYDQYIVQVESRADMRSIGPRPASGPRKWMSEAVYANVLKAASDRWAKYKVLLVKSK